LQSFHLIIDKSRRIAPPAFGLFIVFAAFTEWSDEFRKFFMIGI
jgi:hypothetical protein